MGHSNLSNLQAHVIDAQGIPKAALSRISLADRLMQEVMMTHGCLKTVVGTFGADTLVELSHLQGAVMKDTFIEHETGASRLVECIASLPSGATWLTYVDVVAPT